MDGNVRVIEAPTPAKIVARSDANAFGGTAALSHAEEGEGGGGVKPKARTTSKCLAACESSKPPPSYHRDDQRENIDEKAHT